MYSEAPSPIISGFSPPSSSIRKSITGASSRDTISSIDSLPFTESMSLWILAVIFFIFLANSSFLRVTAKVITLSLSTGKLNKEFIYCSSSSLFTDSENFKTSAADKIEGRSTFLFSSITLLTHSNSILLFA